jgi:ABC-type Mn2+/Zn2+ transport system ATPase subunit
MQRVMLARALAQEADVLLLDEALSGVDAVHTNELITLFCNLASNGTSILVSTHDLSLVRNRFTRCLSVNKRILGDGHPSVELADNKLEQLFTSTTQDETI